MTSNKINDIVYLGKSDTEFLNWSTARYIHFTHGHRKYFAKCETPSGSHDLGKIRQQIYDQTNLSANITIPNDFIPVSKYDLSCNISKHDIGVYQLKHAIEEYSRYDLNTYIYHI